MQTFPTPPDFEEHSLSDQVTFGIGIVNMQEIGHTHHISQREPTLTKPATQKLLSMDQDLTSRPMTNSNSTEEKILTKKDRRKEINPKKVNIFPYSAIVYLKVQLEGQIYRGSGALVGPCHVLTASHNIYGNGSKWAEHIEVIPAYNGKEVPFGIATVCHIHRFVRCDLALLILDRPIGDLTGWFGMMAHQNGQKAAKIRNLRVTGYPGRDTKDKNTDWMFSHKGEIRESDDIMIRYDIDTLPGQSGSPIWIKGIKERTVIGIHTHGAEPGKALNIGVFLNYERLKKIKEWMENRYFITSEPELSKPIMTTISEPTQLDICEEKLHKMKEKLREFFLISWKEKCLTIKQVEISRISMSAKEFIYSYVMKDLLDKLTTMSETDYMQPLETLKIEFKANKALIDAYDSFPFIHLKKLINLPHLKALRRLHLHIPNWKNRKTSDSGDLADLGEALLTTQLQSLSLSLGGPNSNYDDEALNKLIQVFSSQGFPKLQTLHLDFSGCYEATEASIINLSKNLATSSGFDAIKDFSCTFGRLQATDNSLSSLSEAFTSPNFTGLQHLGLLFPMNNEITDEGIDYLIIALVSLGSKGFQTLLLDLEGCQLISPKTINQIRTSLGFENFSELKDLSLSFPPKILLSQQYKLAVGKRDVIKEACEATGIDVETPMQNYRAMFFEAVNIYQSEIKTFDTYLETGNDGFPQIKPGGDSIQNDLLVDISQTMREMSNMMDNLNQLSQKHFSRGPPMSNELQQPKTPSERYLEIPYNYLHFWALTFKNVPNLRDLKLFILEINDDSLESLSQMLESVAFPMLNSLDLDLRFGKCELPRNGLNRFMEALSSHNLKQLKQINLKISDLLDDQVSQFASGCQAVIFKNLEGLSLHFHDFEIPPKNFTQITDTIIRCHMPHLKRLHLSFLDCKLYDKQLEQLGDALTLLNPKLFEDFNLTVKEVILSSCITTDGIWYLATKLASMSKFYLKSLHLDLKYVKDCPVDFETRLADVFLYPKFNNLESFYIRVQDYLRNSEGL